MTTVDTHVLDDKVQQMYRQVAEQPHGNYHFEMGRPLAQRLGYPAALLRAAPVEAVESFAGVGYFFDLANLQPGQRVLDLGSGSGMDTFVAAHLVAPSGRVLGVDFTQEQLDKARRLAAAAQLGAAVEFWQRRIEVLPAGDAEFDCVISNGVINLSADKKRVFTEVARVLRPGGYLAVADIVTERQLTDAIVSNADLWASCVGGAAREDAYRALIEMSGLEVREVRPNNYGFRSEQARGATSTYGVKSLSLLAVKP
ncbi:methyltransferase domain-containing protein [Haloactinomyces albus]|uniref:Arsenite methyltransferase n=1 Tax=Haloactinomyces albus TaxID=1352928 RepID=A0AAE4CLM5_9ACTN|nr:methyltransferase domain-containing protein [Haloactinomyces albus]MDR7300087.1 SAM-dependent methyltransferase [Haloactinomyces albus]